MLALRRLIAHCCDADFLNLEASGAGQWCLQSLTSSIRELRIAAGRTLAAFLRASHGGWADPDLFERNMTNSIAFLHSVSEKAEPRFVEGYILAWGQLGRVAPDEELNLVLIKLVEYLRTGNTIVSAFAFNEFLLLAEDRKTTLHELLEPYWGSLAYLTTKDMVTRPQTIGRVAELLQISVNDLLLLVQSHALPWLVLHRKKEVIQKIAEARQERESYLPFMDNANLAPTLALLLMQDSEDIEELAKSRLDEVSSYFHSASISFLVQAEPVLLTMELLKAASDNNASNQSLVSTIRCMC